MITQWRLFQATAAGSSGLSGPRSIVTPVPGPRRCRRLERSPGGRGAWAYFLRADTMHSLYTYLEENPGRRPERFHERSHGEGFLDILRTRVNQPGFYLMGEPDAPLSFVASLGLVALLHDLVVEGSQAVVATHSPVVASVPGAHILELGEWGMRPVSQWADLGVVQSWRAFLNDPGMYLRHLFQDGDLSLLDDFDPYRYVMCLKDHGTEGRSWSS
jgi:hypothetical protein